jgi:hypothetical protein
MRASRSSSCPANLTKGKGGLLLLGASAIAAAAATVAGLPTAYLPLRTALNTPLLLAENAFNGTKQVVGKG